MREPNETRKEWKEPQSFIGGDYYHECMKTQEMGGTKRENILLETSARPVISGRGHIRGDRNSKPTSARATIVCAFKTEGKNYADQYWKLGVMIINEQPHKTMNKH